jgi:hypothetical protein
LKSLSNANEETIFHVFREDNAKFLWSNAGQNVYFAAPELNNHEINATYAPEIISGKNPPQEERAAVL